MHGGQWPRHHVKNGRDRKGNNRATRKEGMSPPRHQERNVGRGGRSMPRRKLPSILVAWLLPVISVSLSLFFLLRFRSISISMVVYTFSLGSSLYLSLSAYLYICTSVYIVHSRRPSGPPRSSILRNPWGHHFVQYRIPFGLNLGARFGSESDPVWV